MNTAQHQQLRLPGIGQRAGIRCPFTVRIPAVGRLKMKTKQSARQNLSYQISDDFTNGYHISSNFMLTVKRFFLL